MFQLNKKPAAGSEKKANTAKPVLMAKEDTEEIREIMRWSDQNKAKITKFLDKVKENYNGTVTPEVRYVEGRYLYLALKEIEEVVTNVDFLEKLAHPKLDLLERFVHNRFLVCPEHQSSFLVNVRLFCPKCNSIGIEKLHLLEHKSCGYLAEKSKFSDSEQDSLKCPSCAKSIKAPQKELRIPATWYLCGDCKEKFDDATISFYCKEYDHDFNVSEAKTITVYGYNLTSSGTRPPFDYQKLKSEITGMLAKLGFSPEENHTVKGRSGHDHSVDVYGIDDKGQSVFVLINNSDQNDSVDSRIIQILDTSPKIAILIGYASITEKTKSIASKYNVSIILSQNIAEILSEAEKAISHKLQINSEQKK